MKILDISDTFSDQMSDFNDYLDRGDDLHYEHDICWNYTFNFFTYFNLILKHCKTKRID